MNRTSKTFSVSLPIELADAVDRAANHNRLSSGLMIAEIIQEHFLRPDVSGLPDDAKEDLRLLQGLRNDAIDEMNKIREPNCFPEDITLKTFQACQNDLDWLKRYEKYIRGNALVPGNPRKTNANQTIGSRIKSNLGAEDVVDATGKVQRGRAPAGSIIQTYQLLRPK